MATIKNNREGRVIYMKFDKFPEENSQLIRAEAQNNIDRLTADSAEHQENLQKRLNLEINSSGTKAVFRGIQMGAMIGCIFCVGVCVFDVIMLEMDAPILEIITMGVCILLGAVFGAIGGINHKPKGRAYERQLQEEAERLQKDVKTINEDAGLRCNNYRDAFENAVQEASTYFINNPITEEIAGMLWEQFKKQIDEADRSSSTQYVMEEFVFFTLEGSVYTSVKEKSRYGQPPTYRKEEYNFCEHRVEILDLERMAALAKALETALQLRGMTEYAQDISGTVPRITVQSERISDSEGREVKSIVTYSAANGSYQQLRSW